MTSFCVSVSFWPVGQGLFSSGCIEIDNQKYPFHWIYDCGSQNKDNVKNGIKLYEKAVVIEDNIVDLVTISHFDKDHVSGLHTLLEHRNIKYLLLPYLSLWERLIIAVESELDLSIESDATFLEFLIDPVAYLNKRYGPEGEGNKIQEIVFVPTATDDLRRGEEVDDPDREGAEVGLQFTRYQLFDSDLGSSGIIVSVIGYKIPMILSGIWEFLPYNDKNLAAMLSAEFIEEVKILAENFKSSNSNRQLLLADLKAKYTKNFTKENANKISLFLYSGPLDNKENLKLFHFYKDAYELAYSNKYDLCLHRYLTGDFINLYGTYKGSILYTGDGFLTSDDEFDQMELFFDKKRLEKISFFQVMHHGSRTNWYRGIADKISPEWSIFSADSANKRYRHPHAEVLRDFFPYQPILVNKVGAHFCMYCS